MKWNWERPIDDKPTNELPGTQAKIEVMRDRVSREKCPHHPDDTRYDEVAVERIINRQDVNCIATKIATPNTQRATIIAGSLLRAAIWLGCKTQIA